MRLNANTLVQSILKFIVFSTGNFNWFKEDLKMKIDQEREITEIIRYLTFHNANTS